VNVFADGAAVPSSPKRLNSIDPGKTERLVFPVRAPEPGKFVLVNAVLDFFDDNLQNNAMSRQLRGDDGVRRVRPADAWNTLRRLVTDPKLAELLEGYHCAEVEGDGLSAAEVAALLEDIRNGKARVTGMRLPEKP
jgi:hypothetical protein